MNYLVPMLIRASGMDLKTWSCRKDRVNPIMIGYRNPWKGIFVLTWGPAKATVKDGKCLYMLFQHKSFSPELFSLLYSYLGLPKRSPSNNKCLSKGPEPLTRLLETDRSESLGLSTVFSLFMLVCFQTEECPRNIRIVVGTVNICKF